MSWKVFYVTITMTTTMITKLTVMMIIIMVFFPLNVIVSSM